MTNESKSLDLTGLGEVAKSIPAEVYTQTATTVLTTFNKLVAPITETTNGLGRYIKQKFDNMIDVEKAVATYTLDNAVIKAQIKAVALGQSISPPIHHKSFVKTLDEASKETDPLLHEMWENLLAEQLVDDAFHPHFVEILSHFSPREASLLVSLKPKAEITVHCGGYISYDVDHFTYWLRNGDNTELNNWDYSCILLNEFQFIGLLSPGKEKYPEGTAILYRTRSGDAFLKAVSS
ncbi:Abi-alpha family protein [Psychromonas aquimarina]|uniref:Abi-alpha family protein n=1 Tax=Psychromonas aquimarina TaxID=444919 RepID=UPI00040A443D|nr:Abi-alpha family protein [Psychromonas aquimarina]